MTRTTRKIWRCLTITILCGWMGSAVPSVVADDAEAVLHLPFVDTRRAGWGLFGIQVQNVHPSQPAWLTAAFHPQDGSEPLEVRRPGLPAGSAANIYLSSEPDLSAEGPSAVILRSDRPIGAIARGDWSETGAAAIYSQAESGSEVVVPLVLKGYFGQSSMVSIQNTDVESAHLVDIELRAVGASSPTLTFSTEIAAGTSTSLHLNLDERLLELPHGFLGSLTARASKAPIAAQAYVLSESNPGAIYAFEGQPIDRAANRLYAPLIRNDFYGTTGIAVANPGDTDIEVRVTYIGSDLTPVCTGRHLHGGRAAIVQAGSSLIFYQGGITPGAGAPGLPAGCLGSAIIESDDGGMMAVVIDANPALGTAAAYTAAADEKGANSVAIPLYRNRHTSDQLSTGIQVMNLGQSAATVDLTYSIPDRPGEISGCGEVCKAEIEPLAAHSWFPPAMFPGQVNDWGSAVVESDQPIAVIVNDASATGTIDSAMYNGIPRD